MGRESGGAGEGSGVCGVRAPWGASWSYKNEGVGDGVGLADGVGWYA